MREHCQPLEGKPGKRKRPRDPVLGKDGVAPKQPRSPPQQGCQKSFDPDLKEQDPGLSDCPKPPPSDLTSPALGSCPAKGQKGGAGLGIGGEALLHSHHQPRSVHREGAHSCLGGGGDTHPRTVAVRPA